MTSTIIVLSLLASSAAFIYFKARRSGKVKEQLKQKEGELKHAENEKDAWREKPVVSDDIDDELHKLAENAKRRKS